MGLFWSMRPEPLQKKHPRLLKKDVTTPLVVTVVVLKGHLGWEKLFDPSLKPLAELKVFRWYKDKCVRRERVRQGNVQGALFTPSGMSFLWLLLHLRTKSINLYENIIFINIHMSHII